MAKKNYESAVQMIAVAGESKSRSLLAIEAASRNKFEEAELLLQQASDHLDEAYRLQLDMLNDEMEGKPVEISILLIHAQNQLTMAVMAHERAEESIRLYRIIFGTSNG